ncbi:winged helix-turn-helix transcriptional regulator [Nocardioides bizhenqiangii]|uniref:Helix-turn-helix domain-containing protein n=1 Tax=Nocardioides bizhenqiangii TaxID=3095076 RepID=A0ABZ0ZWV4_9ACTN|nr:helix-turn-helix domain-containing protein [Nocardioides sp. HM61]WQQ28837.1 helix-turn-helix domain-containing protein [Nocardioides sp. HM61]
MDLPPDAFARECASRVVLDRIGDRWTVLIVVALADGAIRFSQLRSRIEGITPKVLTQTLRALERDGVVTRTVFAEVPPRVEYELTELGRDLLAPIDAIRIWAEQHAARIVANRGRYDVAADRLRARS